jgi:membrane protease YdiL (CAAX protease family)
VQFFCVEFFFRGFLIFMLRPRFGYGAIAVMVVPYSMIHFAKPMPEAMAAVVGGVILGWLAFKTQSIWGGVLLHVAVALSMDVLAMLGNDTGFPAVW